MKIVAIGGGHGLAASLRALRLLGEDVTAVVSVADNGGSTGRLRERSAMPALGDLRKCLVSLAASDSLFVRSLEHRFDAGELAGHTLGNLLLAAMAEESELVEALHELGRLTGAVGTVLPATTAAVTLVATTMDGHEVSGQVDVMHTGDIDRVRTEPSSAGAELQAIAAIETADIVVLGPGSLFTSVLASLVVPGIREALERSEARSIYVCNLRPQEAETTGFGVQEHLDTLTRHGIVPDVALYDPSLLSPPDPESSGQVLVSTALSESCGFVHDPHLLSRAIKQLF